MKATKKMFLFLLLVAISVILDLSESYTEIELLGMEFHRRILHQPLFPATTPPATTTDPPPSPAAQIPDPSKQPFFPETPNGTQTTPPDQTPTTNPTTSTPSPLNVSPQVPVATSASNPTKKVAVAISVGIVTLGMLSALAFFLYKHRHKHSTESSSQKLVGTRNSQQQQQESMPPTSEFLYLGTMEPASNRRVSNSNSSDTNNYSNGSPYHKLQSLRRSELNHPSPELQPLPPLTRNPLGGDSSPPNISYEAPYKTSPSAMSSEDTFYSPQNEAVGESPPITRGIFFGSFKSSVISTTPHSKRSSPKSRLSISSSPDVKLSELRQAPPPPPPPPILQPPRNQVPRRNTKYQSPPGPPPNLMIPKAVNDTSPRNLRSSSVPLPPRPPPPPPPLGTARSLEAKASTVPTPQFVAPTPKPAIRAEISSPVVEEHNEVEDGRPKLRPLHWDKVRATSDRVMVWDQLNSGSFQVNEDMIETLFGQNQAPTESNRRSSFPPVPKENQVLDPKKSQNIAILLRALNVTQDEVSEALLDGNPEGLGTELLETLVKMAPTKEEELKLINYNGDLSKLGSAERFLKAVLDIPFAFRRVDAMLYRANFEAEINYLKKSYETLEAACGELRNSRLFLKLLEAVLQTGNRMNVGTNRGDARAFKLDTLLKLVDIKGTDGKTTLLHFVVQEIIRYEGASAKRALENPLSETKPGVKEDDVKKQGLQVVAALSRELGNVKKAAGMDSDVLSCYLLKLEKGLEKVRLALQNENSKTEGKFFGEMKLFLSEAKEEILRVKGDEKKTLFHVKEVTEYFHGDTAKEEPHPFRVFMIVRDFLSVLDHVCKEVGELQNRTMVGASRSFRVPANTSLPVLNRFNTREQGSPDWDTMSP
ncbi:hypothetical protein MKW98_031945 [Papaver atlanticum]|uniref:Formin-like protein n=1 Tax=Papaver atlanticum TaxID=357466 RepID=A0AAD4SE56_9MAGN|nr:hypothetical protein MKW98_031945 [Papaver atlanticum]